MIVKNVRLRPLKTVSRHLTRPSSEAKLTSEISLRCRESSIDARFQSFTDPFTNSKTGSDWYAIDVETPCTTRPELVDSSHD